MPFGVATLLGRFLQGGALEDRHRRSYAACPRCAFVVVSRRTDCPTENTPEPHRAWHRDGQPSRVPVRSTAAIPAVHTGGIYKSLTTPSSDHPLPARATDE